MHKEQLIKRNMLSITMHLSCFSSKTMAFNVFSGATKVPLIPGNKASFSSYPALLYSGDDFHILGSGLVRKLFHDTMCFNGRNVKPGS